MRASLGTPASSFRTVPGCYIDSALVTPGQAYTLETMTSFALVFIAFGVGLDPRQRQVFGPALSPILASLSPSARAYLTFQRSALRSASAALHPVLSNQVMLVLVSIGSSW